MKKRTRYDPNKIITMGNIANIVLYDKHCKEKARAIIDTEDVEKVNNYKWCLATDGYVRTSSNGNNMAAIQNIIMNFMAGTNQLIDHRDRNPLNNCKSNFRICTHLENCRNVGKTKRNKSGFKGVCWDKRTKKWSSTIMVNYKNIHLGRFEDIKEAAMAYNKAAIEYFGKFAYIN